MFNELSVGVGFYFIRGCPSKWFHVRKVGQSDWSDIVKELQSVCDKFGLVIWRRIPELAPVLLSTTIPGYLVHVVLLTC
jgi:hypothetical protein